MEDSFRGRCGGCCELLGDGFANRLLELDTFLELSSSSGTPTVVIFTSLHWKQKGGVSTSLMVLERVDQLIEHTQYLMS